MEFLFGSSLPRCVSGILGRSRFDLNRGLQEAKEFLLATAQLLARELQKRPDVS